MNGEEPGKVLGKKKYELFEGTNFGKFSNFKVGPKSSKSRIGSLTTKGVDMNLECH